MDARTSGLAPRVLFVVRLVEEHIPQKTSVLVTATHSDCLLL